MLFIIMQAAAGAAMELSVDPSGTERLCFDVVLHPRITIENVGALGTFPRAGRMEVRRTEAFNGPVGRFIYENEPRDSWPFAQQIPARFRVIMNLPAPAFDRFVQRPNFATPHVVIGIQDRGYVIRHMAGGGPFDFTYHEGSENSEKLSHAVLLQLSSGLSVQDPLLSLVRSLDYAEQDEE
jgi:hypothetical protein